jgi:hypothetical protein
MLEFLNGPGKRILVTLLGVGSVALNKKFGLNLGDAEIAAIASLIITFVGQSAWKEAAMAKAEVAAGNVNTLEDAAKVLGPQPVPDPKPTVKP